MAEEVILKYQNRELDQAIQKADKIKANLRAALLAGKDVDVRQVAGDLLGAERVSGKLQLQRLREQSRGGRIRGIQAGGPENAFLGLRGRSIFSKALSTISAAKTQSFSSALNLGASFAGGPGGLVAQAVTVTLEILRPLIEKENERQRRIILGEFKLEIAQLRRELEFQPGADTPRQRLIRREAAEQAARELLVDSARSPVSARLEGL